MNISEHNFGGLVLSRNTEVNLLQYENAQVPMFVTFFGILMETNLVHSMKAYPSIFVRPSGRITVDNELQCENAYSLMRVIPSGIITDSKFEHS